MGRVDKNLIPANALKYSELNKLGLYNVIDTLTNSNNTLVEKLYVDTDNLPETVKGLVDKSKQELLEIIARKDAVEVQQQESIKSHVEEINKLSNDYQNLKSINAQVVRDYNNAQTFVCIAIIIWVISIIAYFVL